MADTVAGLERTLYVTIWKRIVDAMSSIRAHAAGCAAVDASAIPDLQRRVGAVIKELHGKLVRYLGQIDADRVMCPLILYTDEVILGKLPAGMRPAWPLLQQAHYDFNDGGERFFQLAEESMHKADTSELLLEVMLYCLCHGFQGRYQGLKDKAQRIQHYKTQLERRLGILPQEESAAQTRRGRGRRVTSGRTASTRQPGVHLPLVAPLVLYFVTFLILGAIPLVTVFLSNLELRATPPPDKPSSSASPEQDEDHFVGDAPPDTFPIETPADSAKDRSPPAPEVK
jgi:type IV/VI secretion system ImpK/VasF family protein